MSCADWLRMERPEEENYVYDQGCRNCRYYYCDESDGRESKRPSCHNPESEYYCQLSPTMWCWAWKKAKKAYVHADSQEVMTGNA